MKPAFNRYLRIPEGPFAGHLIARTCKSWLPAIHRSLRSRHAPHIGEKQKRRAIRNLYLSEENALALEA